MKKLKKSDPGIDSCRTEKLRREFIEIGLRFLLDLKKYDCVKSCGCIVDKLNKIIFYHDHEKEFMEHRALFRRSVLFVSPTTCFHSRF